MLQDVMLYSALKETLCRKIASNDYCYVYNRLYKNVSYILYIFLNLTLPQYNYS